jgi:hypothetical protein
LLNVVKRVPRLRAAGAAGLAAFGCTVAAEAALAPLIASKKLEAGARRRRFFFGDEDARSVGRRLSAPTECSDR